MNNLYQNISLKLCQRISTLIVLTTFISTTVIPPSYAQAVLNLPHPGTMIPLSPVFAPAVMKGIKVHPDNPLQFDFIIDTGHSKLSGDDLKNESTKLIKYFLTSLTVPAEDLWVNLSPYEKDRVIPDEFGQTEMGRDLLAQDYILKQLTASLIYPENDFGKDFWSKVYKQAQEKYGTTDIPVNTFNKVWIVPQKAVVYENGDIAFIVESRLKVMLEEDYLARRSEFLDHNSELHPAPDDGLKNEISTQIIREVLIPAIEKEVNEGQNFIQLRQIYYSLILAAWFKRSLKENILAKAYVDQNKINGVDIEDKQIKEKIYQQYLEAFKKGAYNYIKEEYDPQTQEVISRKYFSGGAKMGDVDQAMLVQRTTNETILQATEDTKEGELVEVQAGLDFTRWAHEGFHRKAKIRKVLEKRYRKQESVKGRSLRDIEQEMRAASESNRDLDIKPTYITEDGIKIYLDNFEGDHAGRDRRVIFARNAAKAEHELTELRLWEKFVLDQEIATRDEIQNNQMGTKLQAWANDQHISLEERLKRQVLLMQKSQEFHHEALKAEGKDSEAREVEIGNIDKPIDSFDVAIASEGQGMLPRAQQKAFDIELDRLSVEESNKKEVKLSELEANYGFLDDSHEVVQFVRKHLEMFYSPDVTPEDKLDIRVLARKGLGINAMISSDGVIIVTPELIEFFDAEEELEFVLLHELNHWLKEHFKILKESPRGLKLAKHIKYLGLERYTEYEADVSAFFQLMSNKRSGQGALQALKKIAEYEKRYPKFMRWDAAHGTASDRLLNLKGFSYFITLSYLDAPLTKISGDIKKALSKLLRGGLLNLAKARPFANEKNYDDIKREEIATDSNYLDNLERRKKDILTRVSSKGLIIIFNQIHKEIYSAEARLKQQANLLKDKDYSDKEVKKMVIFESENRDHFLRLTRWVWEELKKRIINGGLATGTPVEQNLLEAILLEITAGWPYQMAYAYGDVEDPDVPDDYDITVDVKKPWVTLGILDEESTFYRYLADQSHFDFVTDLFRDGTKLASLLKRAGLFLAPDFLNIVRNLNTKLINITKKSDKGFNVDKHTQLMASIVRFSIPYLSDKELKDLITNLIFEGAQQLLNTKQWKKNEKQYLAAWLTALGDLRNKIDYQQLKSLISDLPKKEKKKGEVLDLWLKQNSPEYVDLLKEEEKEKAIKQEALDLQKTIEKLPPRERRLDNPEYIELMKRLIVMIKSFDDNEKFFLYDHIQDKKSEDIYGNRYQWFRTLLTESLDDLKIYVAGIAILSANDSEYQKHLSNMRIYSFSSLEELNIFAKSVKDPILMAQILGGSPSFESSDFELNSLQFYRDLAEEILLEVLDSVKNVDQFFDILGQYLPSWKANSNPKIVAQGISLLDLKSKDMDGQSRDRLLLLSFFFSDPFIKQQFQEYLILERVKKLSFEEAIDLVFNKYEVQGGIASFRVLEHIIEEKAEEPPHFEFLKSKRKLFLDALKGSKLAGGATIVDGLFEKKIGARDRTFILVQLLKSFRDDSDLRMYLGNAWIALYHDEFYSHMQKSFPKATDKEGWVKWGNEKPDFRWDPLKGFDKLFLEDSKSIVPFEEVMARLYRMSDIERYFLLRKLLGGEDGVLNSVDNRRRFFSNFIKNYVNRKDKGSDDAMGQVVDHVMGALLDSAPQDELYYMLNQLLVGRISIPPRSGKADNRGLHVEDLVNSLVDEMEAREFFLERPKTHLARALLKEEIRERGWEDEEDWEGDTETHEDDRSRKKEREDDEEIGLWDRDEERGHGEGLADDDSSKEKVGFTPEVRQVIRDAIRKRLMWYIRGVPPDAKKRDSTKEENMWELIPPDLRQKQDGEMDDLGLILESAQRLGAPGVRFLQLLGQTIDLPEEQREKFLTVYDTIKGQSKLTAWETINEVLPEYAQRIRKIKMRLGGGSLYTVYEVEIDDDLSDYPELAQKLGLNLAGETTLENKTQALVQWLWSLDINKAVIGSNRLEQNEVVKTIIAEIQKSGELDKDKISARIREAAQKMGILTPIKAEVIRVLNPNALYHANLYLKILRDALNKLIAIDEKYRAAEPLLDLLSEWINNESEDKTFEEDDIQFRNQWNPDGKNKPSANWTRKIIIPESVKTGTHIVRREQIIDPKEGQNFTELDAIMKSNPVEAKELVALATQHYMAQIIGGWSILAALSAGEQLVHSDVSPGNLRKTKEGNLAILDRGMYLRINAKDRMFLYKLRLATNVAEANNKLEILKRLVPIFVQEFWDVERLRDLDQETVIKDIIEEVNSYETNDIEKISIYVRIAMTKRGIIIPLKYTLLFKNLNVLNRMAKAVGLGSIVEALAYKPADDTPPLPPDDKSDKGPHQPSDKKDKDAAALTNPSEVGGIDLNANKLDLQIRGKGIKFDVPVDPAMLNELNNPTFNGFTPIIFNIIPANLPLFLGIIESTEKNQLSSVK